MLAWKKCDSVNRLGLALLALASCCLVGAGIPDLPAGELAQRIEAITGAAEFQNSSWGLLVADRATGEVLYEANADRLFMPASTTKLYSTAAALDALGADYRFETPIYRFGEVDASGRLAGDLVLVASGDPTLGGRTLSDGTIAFTNTDHTYADGSAGASLTEPDPLAGLDQLAQQVYAAGVRQIAGDLLIDDRLFEAAESTGSGPRQVTPILVNDNLIDLVCQPTGEGQPAEVRRRPETALVAFENRVQTVAAGQPTQIEIEVTVAPGDEPRRLTIKGQIAADAGKRVVVIEVDDPAAWARGLLLEALARAGVTCDAPRWAAIDKAKLPEPAAYGTAPCLARLVSPPLSEEIKLVLKVSHNLHASLLPMLVATRRGQRTLAEGLRAEGEFLTRAGVDVRTISFGGGAGGSRADYTTPRATVALLRHMAGRADFEHYRRGLPVLGVDGTLHDAVSPESPARGAAQAKTGTFYWRNELQGRWLLLSKALAGYLTTRQGRELAFSLVVNQVHLDAPEDRARIGRVLGRICEEIYAGP